MKKLNLDRKFIDFSGNELGKNIDSKQVLLNLLSTARGFTNVDAVKIVSLGNKLSELGVKEYIASDDDIKYITKSLESNGPGYVVHVIAEMQKMLDEAEDYDPNKKDK